MQITIISKQDCPHCVEAKNIANHLIGDRVEILDVATSERARDIMHDWKFTTYPQVFIDGKHLGGCTEFRELALDFLET